MVGADVVGLESDPKFLIRRDREPLTARLVTPLGDCAALQAQSQRGLVAPDDACSGGAPTTDGALDSGRIPERGPRFGSVPVDAPA